jgi:hypothetical protein
MEHLCLTAQGQTCKLAGLVEGAVL